MVITEVQETDASFIFAGTWTLETITSASGGTCQNTIVAGSTCTITFSGHSIFLVHKELFTFGTFSVTIDGQLLPNVYDCSCNITYPSGAAGVMHRNVQLIASGLSDSPHTMILTCLAAQAYAPRNGNVGMNVDSVLICSGQKAQFGNSGVMCCIGDSTSAAYGAWQPDGNWPYRVSRQLSQITKRAVSVSIANMGSASDCYFAGNYTGSLKLGGQYRMFSTAFAAGPQYITVMFGANDLRPASGSGSGGSCTAADYLRHVRNVCNFCSVAFDLGQTTVVICTPGYMHPHYLCDAIYSPSVSNQSGAFLNYQAAIQGVKSVVAQYPQIRFADVYSAMACRDELVFPNREGDFGLHANDAGQGIQAECILAAFLGTEIDLQQATTNNPWNTR